MKAFASQILSLLSEEKEMREETASGPSASRGPWQKSNDGFFFVEVGQ